MNHPEPIAALVNRYMTEFRHPALPPFTLHQHDRTSVVQWQDHPELCSPAVYAHYDDKLRLYYVGETTNACSRTGTHYRVWKAKGYEVSARIDVIQVCYPWERFSFEQFIYAEFPNYSDLRPAWEARQLELIKRRKRGAV